MIVGQVLADQTGGRLLAAPSEARRNAGGFSLCFVSAGACIAAAGIGAGVSAVSPWLETAPWIVALALFGMPHGGMDWRVHRWLHPRLDLWRSVAAFFPYLGLMLAGLAALAVAPVATSIGFLLLTMVHFGSEDARALGGLGAAWHRVAALARGSLVVAIPFAVAPDAAWRPFAVLTGVQLSPLAAESVSSFSAAVAVLGVGSVVLALALRGDRCPRAAVTAFAAETAAAVLVLSVTPPLYAVGVYFLAVHAFKHSMRMTRTPSLTGAAPGRPIAIRLWSLHVQAAVLTLPAVAIVAAWAWFLDGDVTLRLTAASIGFYLISTLPHHLLGVKADRVTRLHPRPAS